MSETSGYEVGRGKPPVHSRFKKGETGNPGGKPGPAKTARARVKQSALQALEISVCTLDRLRPDTSLESMAYNLTLSAARGNANAIRFLLALLDEPSRPQEPPPQGATAEHDPSTDVPARTVNPQTTGETHTCSLSEGKSQGRIASGTAEIEKTFEKQRVEVPDALSSGKNEGKGSAGVEAPPRPQRPTIRRGGVIVQQGD